MKQFGGKNVLIVGGGKTGLALLGFFLRQGARVTLSDRRDETRIPQVEIMRRAGVTLDLGGHDPAKFKNADLIVVSPGVSLTQPAISAAIEAGVPVWGEIEVAARVLNAPLVAITGTNGKSTVTTLIGRIFEKCGSKTFVGGNLGQPLIEAEREHDWDWIIAEISSFQLEAVQTFRPRHALLLNISEDHLDRYDAMEDYMAAKARIFAAQTENDWAILNSEDSLVQKIAHQGRARRIQFSSRQVLEEGMGFDGRDIVWRHDGSEKRFPAAELKLAGIHNIENVMAALIPPLLEGCPAETAWEAVCRFTGLPHRMTHVRTLDGVSWYDDSKATNVGSVVKSLEGPAAPIILIAGGKDKGGDYGPLRDLVAGKVACLILIGEAAARMEQDLAGTTRIERAADLAEAVQTAHRLATAGTTVLLSPACSSFDMFRDFEDRGDQFASLVRQLPEPQRRDIG
ncbi:UDP-N-acetylmuramoyl-L-alanine--D-glutamate ligase [Geoalkalibacter subterraneus]|uniref:UDP-N-acetylmuramoylalanine--D-glutamate ligase n=1 Tax=Geoalkalibacter subterraneus TaxID=483547 RepID=A0A0B5FGL3_9BACT|nr:UDP-N-acetylmuramoyl-L-alanine--D-glutamate ligase [Geoalkalibacter subterraneus]AJF07292.1 UDP-N-acetylmuramoylalanine--D-glutamate ligase [Geoalkalibacter subterraneus]